MNQIFSFAWKVMFGSWITFLFLDVLRPGFVSDIFSVHWFLLAALGCAGGTIVSWTPSIPPWQGDETRNSRLSPLLRGVWGVILAILIWRAGETFGDLRVFLSLLAFVLPWGLMRALRD